MVKLALERNLGFMSSEEVERLQSSKVAIAGAGGDGGMLAVQLARMGVGEIRLADPDPFEVENLNRQAVCTTATLGENKAVAVSEYLKAINPDIVVPTFTDGITQENVEEFVDGTDLVIDETEFTIHALAVMVSRASRKRKLPVLTAFNIGFGALVTTFHPEGKSIESRLGLSEEADIEEIAKSKVDISRWLPYMPKYGDIDVLRKVSEGEKSAPSVAPGVAIAAGLASSQAFLNLVNGENNRPKPVYAPKAYIVDGLIPEAKIIHYGKLSYYKHLGKTAARHYLGLNPKTSY